MFDDLSIPDFRFECAAAPCWLARALEFRDEVEVGVAAPARDAAAEEDAAANARTTGGAEEGVGVEMEELFPVVLLLLLLLALLLLLITVLDRWLPFGREEVEICAVRAPEGVMVVVTIAAGGCFLAFLAPRKGSWSESRACGDGDETGLGLEEGEGEGDLWLLLLFIVGLPETGTARETGLGGSGEVEREVPMLGPGRGGKCAMDWGLRGIAAAGAGADAGFGRRQGAPTL